jgi:polar amino acid transport system substrate-binding protein
VEEAPVKLTVRLAALGAVASIVVACNGTGTGSSGGPTQPGGSPAGTQAASIDASPVTIAPPAGLITEGKLTDCVDIEYPPLEYFPPDVSDPNQAIGFDVDAARAVADRFGLELEVHSTAFDALIPDLQAGRCDIVWSGLYVSDTRLEVADAVPYMATGQVVMVPTGNPLGIGEESDLCGKTISIQGAGLVQERAEAASARCEDAGLDPIDIQAYGKVADQFLQIVNGQVDAVWETDTGVLNFMFDHPNEYEVAYAMPREDNYGVYYGKGKTDLGDALSAAIDALNADGTLAVIAQRYGMDPAILEVIE